MQHRSIAFALVVLGLVAAADGAAAATSSALAAHAAAASAGHASAAPKKGAPTAAPAKLVDINSASRAELKALPGIGNAEADRIVAGRPYLSKADLASRKVLPAGVYVSLKKRIVALPKAQPQVAAAAKSPA